MPKTKVQNIVFTLITALLMVYLMTVYNIAINSSDGLTNETLLMALTSFYIEYLVAVLVAFFIGTLLAKRLAFKVVDPKKDNNFFIILFIQIFTVCIMVALMSMFILFTKQSIDSNFICTYITLVCKNFIMALPLQIFLVGPVVRKLFRLIFKKQLQEA